MVKLSLAMRQPWVRFPPEAFKNMKTPGYTQMFWGFMVEYLICNQHFASLMLDAVLMIVSISWESCYSIIH